MIKRISKRNTNLDKTLNIEVCKAHLSLSAVIPVEFVVESGAEVLARLFRSDIGALPEHAHAEAQLSFLNRGSFASFLTHSAVGRSSIVSVAPGSFAFMTHQQPHRTHWQGDGELLNLYFPVEFLSRLADSPGRKAALPPLSYRHESVVSAIGQSLFDEFSWSGQIAAGNVDHARFLIGMRLLRIEEFESSKAFSGKLSIRRLQPALEFLNAYPERDTSLATLASLCEVSVYHFARSFKTHLGFAPFQYQRKSSLTESSRAPDRFASRRGGRWHYRGDGQSQSLLQTLS